jgi:endoglucanase
MGPGPLSRAGRRPAWLLVFAAPLALAAATGDRARCTLDQGAIVRGPRDAKRVALVFTGDRFAEGAEAILDALKTRRVHASFFLTGRFLREPALRPIVERLRDEGHLLGPHSDRHLLYASWDRPPKLLVTRDQFLADLDANLRAFAPFRVDPGRLRHFLPPYEHYTEEIARWTADRGRVLINHTPGTRSHTDYMEDDDPHFVPAAAIVYSILRADRADPDGLNGYLLLMHLGAGPRRRRDHLHDHLDTLLDKLQARGYSFVRVDTLLGPSR